MAARDHCVDGVGLFAGMRFKFATSFSKNLSSLHHHPQTEPPLFSATCYSCAWNFVMIHMAKKAPSSCPCASGGVVRLSVFLTSPVEH
eukprot:g39942.t1